MKKIKNIFILTLCICLFNTTFALAETNIELVNRIGNRILEKNELPTEITFNFADEDHVNAYANIKGEVYVYKGLIDMVETEDELAGVISHEIGHIVNKHTQKQTILHVLMAPLVKSVSYIAKKTWITKLTEQVGALSLLKVSRNDEYEADITGADLMIGAGYDPLGLISVLNKVSENHLDIISTHPSADKRLVYLYDYVNYNYPKATAKIYDTKSYKEFAQYMAVVVKDRLADPEKMAKYSKKQQKLQTDKLERLSDIKNGFNPWQQSFAILQGLMLEQSTESQAGQNKQ